MEIEQRPLEEAFEPTIEEALLASGLHVQSAWEPDVEEDDADELEDSNGDAVEPVESEVAAAEA